MKIQEVITQAKELDMPFRRRSWAKGLLLRVSGTSIVNHWNGSPTDCHLGGMAIADIMADDWYCAVRYENSKSPLHDGDIVVLNGIGYVYVQGRFYETAKNVALTVDHLYKSYLV